MLDFNCGIYTITSPSGRQYVGSAVNFSKRWAIHRYHLRNGSHHCAPLQRAFDKYGETALTFAKVAFVPRNELYAREQEQIDSRGFANLYNLHPQAGGATGFAPSQETREKMSEARRGKALSARTAAHKQNIRAALEGSTVSRAVARNIQSIAKANRAAGDLKDAQGRSLSASASGFTGVYKMGARWTARAIVAGAPVWIGNFDTPEQAADARLAYLKGLQISTEN